MWTFPRSRRSGHARASRRNTRADLDRGIGQCVSGSSGCSGKLLVAGVDACLFQVLHLSLDLPLDLPLVDLDGIPPAASDHDLFHVDREEPRRVRLGELPCVVERAVCMGRPVVPR